MSRAVVFLLSSLCLTTVCHCDKPRLMVILLDGVRWDYVARDPQLKGFARLAKEGVTVPHVTPIFPSNSYPNWYAISTGLYAESHGIVDNHMYDRERNDSFLMSPDPNVTHEHWWSQAEPLWVSAEKNGIRTVMHYWDGCQVPIRGFKPMQCEPYRRYWDWTGAKPETFSKMLEVLEWFEELETHRLALVYYEGPDAFGHRYGPDAVETKQEMRDTDRLLDLFQDKLEASAVKNQINLVVISDHGMTDVRNSQKIDVAVPSGDQDVILSVGGGASGGILPVHGKEDELLRNLKNGLPSIQVYRKEDIPEKLHIKRGKLIQPVFVMADLGEVLLMPNRSNDNVSTGIHGYDPYIEESNGRNQMRTIMFARGPAFKRGVVGQPIEQTDHYNVFCFILGLTPQPNNGSWSRVRGLLSSDAASFLPMYLLLVPLTLVTVAKWMIELGAEFNTRLSYIF